MYTAFFQIGSETKPLITFLLIELYYGIFYIKAIRTYI